MPEWIYSVIAFVVVTAIIIFFVQKRKKSAWVGVLHKKRYSAGDIESPDTYTLVFKTDEGKKKRYNVSNKVFEQWDEGDSAEKISGEFMPRRVE